MANKLLSRKPDKSVRLAIKKALADGKFWLGDLIAILRAALDGDVITDVEYRDLKRFMRKETRLSDFDRDVINTFLVNNYPMEGPFLYPGVIELVAGSEALGSGQCVALLQKSQPIGRVANWREGIKVKGNGHLIKKGTAIATFEDGLYANRKTGNHGAYYLRQTSDRIWIMDQYDGLIANRDIKSKGKYASGLYRDPSNNADAFSVIMRKK